MWDSDAFKEMFKRRSEFQLNDSAEFYFDNVERLSTADYLPTTDDVLRSRVRTTGIVQSDFTIKGVQFSMCAAPLPVPPALVLVAPSTAFV